MCKEATARREKQAVVKIHMTMQASVVFTINGEPIEAADEPKCLGRVVTSDDDDEAEQRSAE